jgi:WD40 repeat protein
MIAVGTKDGQFMILKEADLSTIETVQHRNQEVSDVKFSPDDRHLAVGTHDNFVDIYSVETKKRKLLVRKRIENTRFFRSWNLQS